MKCILVKLDLQVLIKKKKIVFVHIPKTAGSSIELSLKPHRDARQKIIRRINKSLNSIGSKTQLESIYLNTHASAKDYAAYLGDDFKNYFSFAIVRNPFDRMVSHYHFEKRIYGDIPFKDYLMNRASLKNQIDYLLGGDGKIAVSFIGRLDSLQRDFQFVSAAIGLNLELPHVNKTKHSHYSSTYDQETADFLISHFERDFEAFGYEKSFSTSSTFLTDGACGCQTSLMAS